MAEKPDLPEETLVTRTNRARSRAFLRGDGPDDPRIQAGIDRILAALQGLSIWEATRALATAQERLNRIIVPEVIPDRVADYP